MRHFAAVKDNGEIPYWCGCDEMPVLESIGVSGATRIVECSEADTLRMQAYPGVFFDGGEIKDKPVPPHSTASWDWPSKTWVLNMGDAQKAAATRIDAAFAAAVIATIAYTSVAGVVQTFQADAGSQDVLLKAVIGYGAAGVPPGFFWKAADNTPVPFTVADLQGLYAAMLSRGWAAFQARAAKKHAIATASTVAAVEAITWEP